MNKLVDQKIICIIETLKYRFYPFQIIIKSFGHLPRQCCCILVTTFSLGDFSLLLLILLLYILIFLQLI